MPNTNIFQNRICTKSINRRQNFNLLYNHEPPSKTYFELNEFKAHKRRIFLRLLILSSTSAFSPTICWLMCCNKVDDPQRFSISSRRLLQFTTARNRPKTALSLASVSLATSWNNCSNVNFLLNFISYFCLMASVEVISVCWMDSHRKRLAGVHIPHAIFNTNAAGADGNRLGMVHDMTLQLAFSSSKLQDEWQVILHFVQLVTHWPYGVPIFFATVLFNWNSAFRSPSICCLVIASWIVLSSYIFIRPKLMSCSNSITVEISRFSLSKTSWEGVRDFGSFRHIVSKKEIKFLKFMFHVKLSCNQ